MTQATSDPLSGRIFAIRGQRVMLDADLARLYGTTTKAFNQAIKRNVARFPKDFAFQLTLEEAANLKSQIVTSKSEVHENLSVRGNWSQFVTSSKSTHRGAMREQLATKGAKNAKSGTWSMCGNLENRRSATARFVVRE